MQPVQVNISGYLQLMLIPDNEFDSYGRVEKNLSYSIYLDKKYTIEELLEKEVKRNLMVEISPEYLGQIVIAAPHIIYYYPSCKERAFNVFEIEEIAEKLVEFNAYKA